MAIAPQAADQRRSGFAICHGLIYDSVIRGKKPQQLKLSGQTMDKHTLSGTDQAYPDINIGDVIAAQMLRDTHSITHLKTNNIKAIWRNERGSAAFTPAHPT